MTKGAPVLPNGTFDRTAGSHSLAAAGQRGRSPHGRTRPTALETTWYVVYREAVAWGQIQEGEMSDTTAKQKVLEAIGKLPADATVEDAIEQLVLLAKIEEGLAQLDAGQGVEHSEAKRRLLR